MLPVWSPDRAPSKSSLSSLKKPKNARKAEKTENEGNLCPYYPSTVLELPRPLGLWSRNVHWVCLADRPKMASEVFPQPTERKNP